MAAPSSAEQAKRGSRTGTTAEPSGRLLLRMPRALHGALAQAANREGTSLNQFITRSLAGAIGWSEAGEESPSAAPAPAPGRAEAPPAAAGSSRSLVLLLITNAVVVGLAALAAVGLLLLAWLG